MYTSLYWYTTNHSSFPIPIIHYPRNTFQNLSDYSRFSNIAMSLYASNAIHMPLAAILVTIAVPDYPQPHYHTTSFLPYRPPILPDISLARAASHRVLPKRVSSISINEKWPGTVKAQLATGHITSNRRVASFSTTTICFLPHPGPHLYHARHRHLPDS
jgi:hypothetical protein